MNAVEATTAPSTEQDEDVRRGTEHEHQQRRVLAEVGLAHLVVQRHGLVARRRRRSAADQRDDGQHETEAADDPREEAGPIRPAAVPHSRSKAISV